MSLLAVDITVQRGAIEVKAQFSIDTTSTPNIKSQKNATLAIMGQSGAGKSTLLAAIAGHVTPSAGRITLGDTVLFDKAAGVNLAPERRGVGTVFQDGRLFPHLSVEDNLRFGLKFRRRDDLGLSTENPPILSNQPELSLLKIVQLLGIEALLKRRPHTLSGGERQRVAIGRALLSRPRVLLMDEPLASLDQARRGELMDFIAALPERTGVPIVYVTHQADEVLRVAQQVLILQAGSVVARGAVNAVLSDLTLQPLVGRFDAGAVIEGQVTAHDSEWGLTNVQVNNVVLSVPAIECAISSIVKMRIRARDVSVHTAAPEGSASNVLHATVSQLLPRDAPYLAVAMQLADGQTLWALITQKSAVRLGLAVGVPVFASFKAVAVESRALAVRTV
jgi:molybdate transport system ATP-binding protein